jgi:hypothetical protein
MEVNGQLHAPAAFPQGKSPWYPLEEEAGWATKSVWMRWRRGRNRPSCRKSNPGRPASSLVTILLEVPWLLKEAAPLALNGYTTEIQISQKTFFDVVNI